MKQWSLHVVVAVLNVCAVREKKFEAINMTIGCSMMEGSAICCYQDHTHTQKDTSKK